MDYSFIVKKLHSASGVSLAETAIRWANSNLNTLTEQDVISTFDSLKLRRHLSYVNICPTMWEEPNEKDLTPDEIYAIRTQGSQRDEFVSKKDTPITTPAARPGSDNQTPQIYFGGDSRDSYLMNRLNSSQRFTDFMVNAALKGEEEINMNRKSAESKLGKKTIQRVKSSQQDKARQVSTAASNLFREIAENRASRNFRTQESVANLAMESYVNELNFTD